MKTNYLLIAICLLTICNINSYAQGSKSPEAGIVEFNEKIHDFGDVLERDGALKYKFEFTNISKEPVVVHNVVSSCGCTTPSWSKEPIAPSEKGFINVEYNNDQGPYPFDKTLTVYISGVAKPVVLRIRGTVHQSESDVTKMYHKYKIGDLGFKKRETSIGYLEQGIAREDKMEVANLSKSPLKVETLKASDGLTIEITPNPIPAKSVATLKYKIDPKKFKKQAWGNIKLEAYFKLNGKSYDKDPLTISGSVIDDFSKLSDADKKKAPVISVEKSYVDFGTIKKGETIHSTFSITNSGKSNLTIHSITSEKAGLKLLDAYPITIEPGKTKKIRIDYGTAACDKGEMINIFTVITNVPDKPIINLFLTGTID